MKLLEMDGDYSVYRFAAGDSIPEKILREDGFASVTRTEDELSIVCRSGKVPGAAREEGGWALWKVRGPLDFGMIGVLSAITAPLARASISVFAVSTFDTDYILWKREKNAEAEKVLRSAGFELESRQPYIPT